MADHTFAYAIKNQWLNMSVYFINFMYNTSKPFADTAVGKLLKNPVFKGVVQFYRYAPLVLNPVGLAIAATEIIATKYATDYNNSWATALNDKYVCSYIMTPNRLKDNNDLLGGKQRNSKWFANGDHIQTKFIKLDKADIITFYGNPDNGFAYDKSMLKNPNNYERKSNITSGNGPVKFNITNQERQNNDPASPTWNDDNLYYFLKSTNNNDVIKFLIGSGII
jgi:hypothetical protein